MAPSSSPDPTLDAAEIELLLDIADSAVVDGLHGGMPSLVPLSLLPAALCAHTGVFVTMTVDGELNGCIGSIEGVEPLAHGAARHAWSAAFADPRLPALRRADYGRLVIEVSVLSSLSPMAAASREELLSALRPGVDGLVLAVGAHQAVFLPAVWEQLPDPGVFVDHLQRKAGLPSRSWRSGTRAWRFTATKHGRRARDEPSPSQAA